MLGDMMNYTQEQVDIMIEAACKTQKELDYNIIKQYLERLEKEMDETKETLNFLLEAINQ
jgi:hypothetical protein